MRNYLCTFSNNSAKILETQLNTQIWIKCIFFPKSYEKLETAPTLLFHRKNNYHPYNIAVKFQLQIFSHFVRGHAPNLENLPKYLVFIVTINYIFWQIFKILSMSSDKVRKDLKLKLYSDVLGTVIVPSMKKQRRSCFQFFI